MCNFKIFVILFVDWSIGTELQLGAASNKVNTWPFKEQIPEHFQQQHKKEIKKKQFIYNKLLLIDLKLTI